MANVFTNPASGGLRMAAPREAAPRGAALVEWLLGMTTLMLLAAITIEFAHWQTSRHLAAIALMEAARAGSTQNARPQAMTQAFLHAMRARFPSPAGNEALMLRTFERIKSRTGMPSWEIEQLAPNDLAFEGARRYTGREIQQAHGKRVLRHDLFERDGQARHLDPPRGLGVRSRTRLNSPEGRTHPQAMLNSPEGHGRQQALKNSPASDGPLTLHLRLTYRQPALFPIIARLAAGIVSGKESTTRAWAAGLMVIELEQKIEMQSDAVQW